MNNFLFRFLTLLLIHSFLTNCQVLADHKYHHISKQKLIEKYHLSESDTSKIYYLNKLAHFYSYYELNDFKVDSINNIAIGIAERTLNNRIIINAYNNYLETNNLNSFKKDAGEIVEKAERIANKLLDLDVLFRTFYNIANFHLDNYDYIPALKYAYDAFTIAGNIENNIYKARTYLLIGLCLEEQNKKIDALRNYYSALTIAEEINNKALLLDCYSYISRFYNFCKMYSKSKEYKRKEFELVQTIEPIDSNKIISTLIGFEGIGLSTASHELNESNINFIFNYIDANPNEYLKTDATGLYRTHLVSFKKFDELHKFYTERYPEELIELKEKRYSLYLRIKAFLCEVENELDSALFYYENAAHIIDMHPNKNVIANFYIRFAEFHQRHNNYDEAIYMYTKALQASKQTTYLPFSYKASNSLKKLYAAKEDFTNAYKFSILSTALADSLQRIAKLDQLVAMEIDNESRLLTMLNEREKAKTKRRHNIQYTAIVILIFSAFVVLMVLGKYNVKPWVIRTIGFFAFIFAFEFIILIADNIIHHATHGEPWKILLIKIFLIGVLLPLHHFIEGVAVKYILSRDKKAPKKVISVREFVNKYVLKEGEH